MSAFEAIKRKAEAESYGRRCQWRKWWKLYSWRLADKYDDCSAHTLRYPTLRRTRGRGW